MTLALMPATTPAHSARPPRRGWRATPERPFPTLGWQILEWTYAFLPSPTDEHQPLLYTDEQAHRLLEWYRLDPDTGRFVHNRRLHLEEGKGWGKQPVAASIDVAEFCGPVCFDGWDATGQPVGVPWGTGGRFAPWIQIGAVSEAQTRNTYSWVYWYLTANDGRAARELRIDAGLTRCYLMDNAKAILEFVTAAATSREGQPVTHATLDEVQLWWPSNGGHALADNILGNLTKTNGRAVFTGNAYVKGEHSVAERFDVEEPGVLRYATRAETRPEREWTREQLMDSLRPVYRDVPWVDLDRVVDDATSETADWEGMVRKFWNLPSEGGAHLWMPRGLWADRKGLVELNAALPTYAVVTIAHDHRTAAVAMAQMHGEQVVLRVRRFPDTGSADDELVAVADIEKYVLGLRKQFPARVEAPKVFVDGRERRVLRHGPEVIYHGSFFEGSAQRLRVSDVAVVNLPDTQVRLAPAAESLKGLVLEGRLVHEDDAQLAESIGRVNAVEAATGWYVQAADVSARAAMVAVQRAVGAQQRPKAKPVFHSW